MHGLMHTSLTSESSLSQPSVSSPANPPAQRRHFAQVLRCGAAGILPGSLMILAAISFSQDPQAAHAMRAELAQIRVSDPLPLPEPTRPAAMQQREIARTQVQNPAPVPGLQD